MTDKNNKKDSNSKKNSKEELMELLLQLIEDNPRLFELNIKLEDIYDKIDIENKKSIKKHSKKRTTSKINDSDTKTNNTDIKEYPRQEKHTNSKVSVNTKNNSSYNGIFGNYNEMRCNIENIENEEIREQIEETINRMEEMENNMTPEERERLERYGRIYGNELNRRDNIVNGFLRNGETEENLEKRNLISHYLSTIGINEPELTAIRRGNISQDPEESQLREEALRMMIQGGFVGEGAPALLDIILRADNEIMELFDINGAISEIVDNILQNNKNNKNKQNKR